MFRRGAVQAFVVTVSDLQGTTLAVEEVEVPSARRASALAARRGVFPETPFAVRVTLPTPGSSLLGAGWPGAAYPVASP